MDNYGFTWQTSNEPVPVLTLRDKFAMAALTGLLAGNEFDGLYIRARTAEEAYLLADAMMEAREK